MRGRWIRVPALVAVLAAAAPARADGFYEVGDAGETLSSYQVVQGGTNPLEAIRGQPTATDFADLYAINITSPGSFSATTVNSYSRGLDTVLFLFTSSGAGITATSATATIWSPSIRPR